MVFGKVDRDRKGKGGRLNGGISHGGVSSFPPGRGRGGCKSAPPTPIFPFHPGGAPLAWDWIEIGGRCAVCLWDMDTIHNSSDCCCCGVYSVFWEGRLFL